MQHGYPPSPVAAEFVVRGGVLGAHPAVPNVTYLYAHTGDFLAAYNPDPADPPVPDETLLDLYNTAIKANHDR
jgi:hypothetical protein